ncbi:MAG: helix-turn-helix transcriptional regulator [Candidatus Methanofastidiosa archaeon]|nr:helix-turn-helix transcriptional regulator [Candidatus Methanofastidiosa archaeon]
MIAMNEKIKLGILRLHILHSARNGDVCETEIIGQLSHIDGEISNDTLYRMIREMEGKGYLTSRESTVDGCERRHYRITMKGEDKYVMALDLLQNMLGSMLLPSEGDGS